ncbi:hypothetical protein EVAR_43338_1 [Eumeta japonica]|uniref:Uncharacterized protein n=1 Tax=Eumeta variegata TaxID=151549 RepID=A0A4C1WR76_EUMVA|nr:hypothetical protein EVAR_43338_1 [Eumeta japonica]
MYVFYHKIRESSDIVRKCRWAGGAPARSRARPVVTRVRGQRGRDARPDRSIECAGRVTRNALTCCRGRVPGRVAGGRREGGGDLPLRIYRMGEYGKATATRT